MLQRLLCRQCGSLPNHHGAPGVICCCVLLDFAHILPAGFTHVLQLSPAMPLSYFDVVCPELKHS